MSVRRATDVAALLPGAERFDATGGAIATWVRETYSRSKFSTVVASPRATHAFASPVRIARVPVYDLYERILATTSRILAPRIGKTFQVVYNRLLWDRFWVRSALRQIGEARLIHIHNRPHYAGRLRRAGYQGVVVLHMHNDLRTYVGAAEAGEVFAHIDGVVFCSDFTRSRAVDAFESLPPSVVVPNGVTGTEIDRTIQRRDTEALRLIYVGRIISEKGPLEAIEVCAELRRRGYDARIDIVGGTGAGSENGPTAYLSEVEAAIRDLNQSVGLDAARLLGPRPHAEIFDLFSSSDLFVLPCSWEEPFGMVALEAMAKGCIPVVAARGGLPDVVRDGGVVVAPRSADDTLIDAFADAIEPLAVPAARTSIRRRGWDRAEQLTWESVSADADRMFEKALSTQRDGIAKTETLG